MWRAEEDVNISARQWTDVVLQQRRGHTHIPAVAAPRTSIDLTSLVCPFYPTLFYFPILTPAADASAHFLPSLFDAPSVEHAFVW